MVKEGQNVWVQGKQAIVDRIDERGVWVSFLNDQSGSHLYQPERVCPRSFVV